jgi:hypothetical protein
MSKSARVIAYGSAAVLVVLGLALGIAIGGTFGQVLAIVLIGGGLVAVTGLVFYEVGLSEDRERAREQAAAEQKARRRERADEARVPGSEGQRRSRLRLERRRGQRRRLG